MPRDSLFFIALFLLCHFLGAFCGCASANRDVSHPEAALSEWLEAVYSRDASVVYAYFPDSYKAGVPKEEFNTYFQQNYELFLEQAKRIESGIRVVEPEWIAYSSQDVCGRMVLIRESEGWRFDSAPLLGGLKSEEDPYLREELVSYLNSASFQIGVREWINEHGLWGRVTVEDIMQALSREDVDWSNLEWDAPNLYLHLNDYSKLVFECQMGKWRFREMTYSYR